MVTNATGCESAADTVIVSLDNVTTTGAYLLADCDGDGVTNGDELTPPDGEIPTDPTNPCDFNTKNITLPVTSKVGCNAKISVTKIANVTGTVLGATIYYTIVLENTGSLDLTNITLVDVFLDSNGNSLSLTTEPYFVSSDLGSIEGILLVGENATYMADFDITQEAINAGGVSNRVIVTGTTVNSVIVSDSSDNGDDLDGNTNDDPTETNLGEFIIVYSQFSPNGDGVNDNFVVEPIGNYPDNTLEIYNRWGNIVYKMNSYNNDWNGISNGRVIVNDSENLPEGTYYYKLDLGDGSFPKTGWLYLNR